VSAPFLLLEKPLTNLPIEPAIERVRHQLRARGVVVLQAPPGAGKSTRLPLALLDEPWLGARRIVLVEPRRLVVSSLASYLAAQLSEPVGRRVGYRMRFDTRVSAATRLEVVTAGVFLRRLQKDPELADVGLVIFDEFHERSLDNDLALALSRETQTLFRPDLRLLIMSATLDAESVCQMLQTEDGVAAPLISVAGQSFPVITHYLPREPEQALVPLVVAGVLRALREESGGILVFLPGQGEILRAAESLADAVRQTDVLLIPLFGDLTAERQREALRPAPGGRRKVVLATSIAETSLTIPDIRVVVDGGHTRLPQFDPASGLSRLVTVRVSQAAADQRRGRAGRTAPGVCYRLWSESRQRSLAATTPPEILTADLAPLVLELAAWGTDAAQLCWIDPPPPAALANARELLCQLDALDAHGVITASGRRLADYPLHPRLAHLIDCSRAWNLEGLACRLAALLAERDLLRQEERSDLQLRLWALDDARDAGQTSTVDRATGQRVRQAVRQFEGLLASFPGPVHTGKSGDGRPPCGPADAVGMLLAMAYPDRIAQCRGPGSNRYRLANGKGARLADSDPLAGTDYLVAAHLDGHEREGRIRLAAAVSLDALELCLADRLEQRERIAWDGREQAVVARREIRLGELVLRTQPVTNPPVEVIGRGLCDGIRSTGLDVLPWNDDLRLLQRRAAFIRRSADPSFPDLADATLKATLEDWLLPFLEGLSRLAHLQRLDLRQALRSLLDYPRQRQLETDAPCEWIAPTGTRVRIDYPEDGPPCSEVRLQEVLGQAETPRLGGGQPIQLHLLSPARRPIAVTDDLARFWTLGYPAVRKDMRGRYPRHPWPEDPLAAAPTRAAKPRGT